MVDAVRFEGAARRRRTEATEYRTYYAISFPLFLTAAVARRALSPILPRKAHGFDADAGRLSILGEAKAMANTALPYVFMT